MYSTTCTQKQTHPLSGPLSGTTQVSQYQKGKTNLDFTEARDSEWQWHPLGRMQVCTSLQMDNHATTRPLSFLQAVCPSCRPTTSSNHWRQNCGIESESKIEKANHGTRGNTALKSRPELERSSQVTPAKNHQHLANGIRMTLLCKDVSSSLKHHYCSMLDPHNYSFQALYIWYYYSHSDS